MRGIKRSKQFEDMVRQLIGETSEDQQIKPAFSTMRELMCFAAALGYENARRKPLSEDTLEIDARNWSNSQEAMDLLYLIALVGEKDGEILREDRIDDAVSIFEEYANGGFEVLAQWLKEKPDDLNGDRAILAALAKYGFLGDDSTPTGALGDVDF